MKLKFESLIWPIARDQSSMLTVVASSASIRQTTQSWSLTAASPGIQLIMRHRPGSGKRAVFSLLARVTVACCRYSSTGYGRAGETDDNDNCEAKAFESRRPSVDLRRQDAM